MQRAFGFLIATAMCVVYPASPALASPHGAPIEIPAILSLTGAAAFLGKAEFSALQLVEEQVNTGGGIGGRPVHFAVQDDQTNPQTALQLFNGIVAKGSPIVIGPSLTAACGAIAAVLKSGPVVYCLSPGAHPPKDSWMFSWGPITTDLLGLNVKFFRDRGFKKIALITTTDASGQDGEHAMDAALALPENKDLTLVAREHFNPTDLSVVAQIARIKQSGAQALIAWGTGTPIGTVFHAISDSGLDIPVGVTAGNLIYPLLKQYESILPKELVSAAFPAAASEHPLPGPFQNAVRRYNNAFSTIGVRPDASQVIGWDPALIIVAAYRRLGPAPTADQLKEYLSNLRGYIGATGIYDFRAVPQRGLSVSESGLMVAWDRKTSSFVPIGGPGGASR